MGLGLGGPAAEEINKNNQKEKLGKFTTGCRDT
jgi:hypothetical protein